MNGNGEDTRLEISDRDGKVLWSFSRPTEHMLMEPENARAIAEATAKAAYVCQFGVIANKDSTISEAVRMRLITRATHVIRSLQEKKKLPGFIASEVIDVILSEIY